MGAFDEIPRGRALTAAERRGVSRRRAEAAHAAVLEGGFPITFELGRYRVTIADAALEENVLELFGIEAWRRGRRVPLDPHLRIVNPPLLVADPAGPIELPGADGPRPADRTPPTRWREDPGAIVLRELLTLIERADP